MISSKFLFVFLVSRKARKIKLIEFLERKSNFFIFFESYKKSGHESFSENVSELFFVD